MATLKVKVVAGSKVDKIVGWQEGILKVKIAAPAHQGRANQRLLSFLARSLSLPKSRLVIIKGEKSPKKEIEIAGVSREQLQKLFKV